MDKSKMQETLSDRQLVINALREDNQDNPDFLNKVKRWEEIEKTREMVLSRFPPPKGMWTLSEIEKGIKEKDPEAYSAQVHFIYSDEMMKLMFNALFREDIHQFIAKHAGSQIDDYFLRYIIKLMMTTRELLKLHERLKHQGSEDDIQNALKELWERWTTKEPYLTLLEKVIAGEFAKILPTAVMNKRVSEYKIRMREVSVLELLMTECEPLQMQPEPIEEEITQEQREQLEALLGEKGRAILEYRLQHPEIVGKHGEKKIIAEALRCNDLRIAESTVGEYIGRQKHDGTRYIGILEKKAKAIQKNF